MGNTDNLVAASHWLYLSLRRAGKPADAAAVLQPVMADLDVIENGEYHQLLLMYKGERTPEAVLASAGIDAGGSATRYGVSAWYLVQRSAIDEAGRTVGVHPGRPGLALVRLSGGGGGVGKDDRQPVTARFAPHAPHRRR